MTRKNEGTGVDCSSETGQSYGLRLTREKREEEAVVESGLAAVAGPALAEVGARSPERRTGERGPGPG